MRNYTNKIIVPILLALTIWISLNGCATNKAAVIATGNRNQPTNIANTEKTPTPKTETSETRPVATPSSSPMSSDDINDTRPMNQKSESKITIRNYEQIQDGMTYDEVAKMLGDNPMKTSTMNINGRVTETYMWSDTNDFEQYIDVTFEKKKVVEKSQKGL